MEIKEIKNFLPLEEFKAIQNLILDLEFPWRIRNTMSKVDNNIYFTHSFFNNNSINSNYFSSFITPILNKLNCKAIIEIRANMVLNKIFDKSGWHIDHQILEEEKDHTTAILYLNTCNGGTELRIKNKINFIEAEENKIIIFSSKTFHRAITSTDADKRYIINFNYFE
jgi:hypothetical protein